MSGKVLRDRDGQFAGSVRIGSTHIPTPSEPVMDVTALHDTLVNMYDKGSIVSMDDLYASYQAELATREQPPNAAQGGVVDGGFWEGFVPEPGVDIPARFESHRHLPVGTFVILNGSLKPGLFNGRFYVKTSDSSWAEIYGSTAEVREANARRAARDHATGISPCPAYPDGVWTVLAVV